ncbi:MAG: hypothetical protein LBE49_06090, partial [Deltaproteobacteria bacterium]|jgi:hypothetical protein|nr:hypothetical protein [Deltaproteobacteria bacterium]
MRPLGFQTFDQHILDLFQDKQITEETARTFSSKKTIMARGIDNIKALAGESVISLKNLSLEPFEEDAEVAITPPPAPPSSSQPMQAAGGGRYRS